MRQSKAKIQHFENLFQLTEKREKTKTGIKYSLSADEVAALKTIMDFIKAEAPLPQSLIEWLAQLALLYGVPYNHLVADEKLMSNDQKGTSNLIRFFYIDMKWIDSMIDGALSIGTHNSKDFKLQQAVHKAFRKHIENEMLDMRQKVKGKPLAERTHAESMGTLSGFLLRSPLVLQWPGIEITAFNEVVAIDDYDAKIRDADYAPNIMPVLRMERLAPDTMLMIFKGVPKSILIKEPSEGVYSGVNYVGNENGKSVYELSLRKLEGKGEIGQPIIRSGDTNSHPIKNEEFRNNGRRVLNVAALKNNLSEVYNRPLQPKDMAVLFINSPRYYFYQGSIFNNIGGSNTGDKINIKDGR